MINPYPYPYKRWQYATIMLLHLIAIAYIPLALCDADNANVIELNPLDVELMDAIRDENIEAASAALKSGGNINAISPKGGQTPLMQSVLHGRTKMVEWCLDNGADTTIPERQGYTPMHGAGFQGRADIAALLFKHGVGLRDVHEDGHEPAIRSCWGPEERHTETVAWFLDNGVPIDDIYDKCLEMTKNSKTEAMLKARKGGSEL